MKRSTAYRLVGFLTIFTGLESARQVENRIVAPLMRNEFKQNIKETYLAQNLDDVVAEQKAEASTKLYRPRDDWQYYVPSFPLVFAGFYFGSKIFRKSHDLRGEEKRVEREVAQ